MPSSLPGPRLQVNLTRGWQRNDDRVGEQDLIAVEVLGDFLDVLADLGTLVADQVTGVVPADPRDVSDLAISRAVRLNRYSGASLACVTRSARRASTGTGGRERSRRRLRDCAVQLAEPVLLAGESSVPELAQQAIG